MNWRRGLLRLWLIGSMFWIAFVSVNVPLIGAATAWWTKPTRAEFADQAAKTQRECMDAKFKSGHVDDPLACMPELASKRHYSDLAKQQCRAVYKSAEESCFPKFTAEPPMLRDDAVAILRRYVLRAFGWPAMAAFLGIGLLWAVGGFRPKKTN